MRRTLAIRLGAVVVAMTLPSGSAVDAQRLLFPSVGLSVAGAAEGTVNGSGTARLETPPTVLRMKVDVVGKASTIREALAKLKDRREVALNKLTSLGARQDSIKFSDPTTAVQATSRQRQMEAMIQQRMQARGGAAAKKSDVAVPVSVFSTLSAEWALPSGSAEELLIAASELRDKIKQADLVGGKEAAKLSAEEEELAEETAQLASRYGGAEPADPSVPAFVFVAKISDEQHAKLLAEAFGKAQREAASLATAAGGQLGALHQLNAAQGPTAANPYYGMMEYEGMPQAVVAERDAHEAMGAEPGHLRYEVQVGAAFNLKQP